MGDKCKHENAEHMMPGDASTPDWCVQVYAEVEQFRCIDCGAWLSLGHSDETDERVAIEIRAAEIATRLTGLSASLDLNIVEHYGWTGQETADIKVVRNGVAQLDEDVPLNLDSPKWLAGHLARVIATHGAEQ